jgi:hypothetical protein
VSGWERVVERLGEPSHVEVAGEVERGLNDHQQRALRALVDAGDAGLNDFELAAVTGVPPTSIGVRRGELAGRHLVEQRGVKRPSSTGSPASVWYVTPLGRAVERDMSLGVWGGL